MNRSLPFNAAADRNKVPIGNALEDVFNAASTVFEIGSGTGQHAIYFTGRFDHLVWQCSEQASEVATLTEVLAHATGFSSPKTVEVSSAVVNFDLLQMLSTKSVSLVYSANTAHIMSIDEVASMFQLVEAIMHADGKFALYGPFKIDGQHTSVGNQQFDLSLREQKPHMGIRDRDQLVQIAGTFKLKLKEDIPMPANNRILLWEHR